MANANYEVAAQRRNSSGVPAEKTPCARYHYDLAQWAVSLKLK
jgi:hypothetical protein